MAPPPKFQKDKGLRISRPLSFFVKTVLGKRMGKQSNGFSSPMAAAIPRMAACKAQAPGLRAATAGWDRGGGFALAFAVSRLGAISQGVRWWSRQA